MLDTLSGMRKMEQVRDWIIDRYLNSISQISKEQEDYSNITICVENYILEHFGDPELTIAAISKALFLNYSYICYCFKRDKQMTINDFMNKIRIEKAIGMFQDGIDNVSYVAEKAGYGSASYFSKQFKRATGLPPSDYIRTLGPVSAVRDRA